MLERHIEAKVVKWAKANGIKVKKKMFGEQLDRYFFLPGGKTVVIEFKQPGNKPTAIQSIELAAMKALGFRAEWCDDAEKAIVILQEELCCG